MAGVKKNIMTNTSFKKATNTEDGGTLKYGAPDLKYVFDVLDGTHSTHRLQLTNIEGFVPAFDVVVYQAGGNVIAKRANGTVLYSAAANTGTNDITAINTACNVAVTDGKATSVLIKPGTYTGNGTGATVILVSNLTIVGYGATIKYLGTANSNYFLCNVTTAPTGISNVFIFGLTIDCNTLCQGMRFSGSDSGTQSKNVTIEDCTFKNIYSSYFLLCTYSIPTGTNQADIPTKRNTDIRVIRCNFIAGDTTNSSNSFPLVHFINTRSFFLRECVFDGHTANNQAAAAFSLYCDHGILSNNVFKSSASGEVRDFLLQQSKSIVINANKFCQKVYIQDCRNITVGGNRINNLKVFDKDNAGTDDSHPALYRATRYVLISNNIFDTVPAYDGQNFDTAIELDASDNDTNSPKHITISSNSARCRTSFFRIISALPNGATGGPIEDIMISNNHIYERTSTAANDGLIVLNANTSLTAHGLTRVFITNNYFCTKDAASPACQDIELGGTGFTNIVIRKNFFSNEGINNVSSYAAITRNFGDAATRRDYNSGTASISSGSTNVPVAHGVQYTPNLQDIYCVPTTTLSSAASYWISSPDSTNFTINVNVDPTATVSFAWRVGRIT